MSLQLLEEVLAVKLVDFLDVTENNVALAAQSLRYIFVEQHWNVVLYNVFKWLYIIPFCLYHFSHNQLDGSVKTTTHTKLPVCFVYFTPALLKYLYTADTHFCNFKVCVPQSIFNCRLDMWCRWLLTDKGGRLWFLLQPRSGQLVSSLSSLLHIHKEYII